MTNPTSNIAIQSYPQNRVEQDYLRRSIKSEQNRIKFGFNKPNRNMTSSKIWITGAKMRKKHTI